MWKVILLVLTSCSVATNRGRYLYNVHCTVCHNSDPELDGSLGPALKGSSANLLALKLLEGTYPRSYKPKRTTRIMPKYFMSLEDIIYLEEYLNEK